jgi:hypothetical protein
MKIKAILLAFAVSAVSVFGQGLVTFQNSSISTPIKTTFDGGSTFVNIPAGGQAYSFYFTYGSSLQFTSATYFNSDTAAGRIDNTANTQNIALSVPGGQATSFQLFAYSTSAGSYLNSLTAAGAAHYSSGVITLAPSTAPSPGTPMFGVTPGTQFQGFNFAVNPVPEPSTIALGVLGAGSLLFLRRKK